MNVAQSVAKITPASAILLATNLRCLWRRYRTGHKLQFRSVSQKSALVISPHPDDETFGCGALISLKRLKGVPVRIVFMTSGEAVAGGIGEDAQVIVSIRQAQALTACQHLGVDPVNVHWLNLPDGRLPKIGESGFKEARKKLESVLRDFPAGEILCPHPRDCNRDHEATADLVQDSIAASGVQSALIYYPVWMWFHASSGLRNRLAIGNAWRLDGRSVKRAKATAISAYLDAPPSPSGSLYCGSLPWAFLWNFKYAAEVFFQ